MEKEDHEEKVESVFEVLDDERVNGATNKKNGEKELTMEQILEMKETVLPWRKQLTVRAFAVSSLLSIMFAFVVMFSKSREGRQSPFPALETMRIMGADAVSATNFYKLFSSNSHVLLYPGGMREALHRKGEEYKLFWPEQSEFVRMAAKFGAKITPFGVVGEDDVGHLLLDYNDLRRISYE